MISPKELTDVHIFRIKTSDQECPWGIKAIELLKKRGISYEDHLLLNPEEINAFKKQYSVKTTPQIFSGEINIGGYTELAAKLDEKVSNNNESYVPVIAVFGTTFLMALACKNNIIQQFMGFSICALAMLKIMDISSFASSFAKYDLVTQHWRVWGKLYPGVELLVGLGFLLNPPPVLVGWVALILGIQGMFSIIKAVYIEKLSLNCACIGGNTKTPLGIVSVSEYAIQSLMGIAVAFRMTQYFL